MTKINIKPLGDRVLIEPHKDKVDKGKTDSGIYIPDTASKERSEKGKIVAVGEGRVADDGKLIPMKLKVGQTVLFTKYGPSEIKVGDTEYLIAREEDILAILE